MALGVLLLVVSHLYRVEMALGSLNYARDLLRVERENPLVSYPILDPCYQAEIFSTCSTKWLIKVSITFIYFS